MPPDSRIIVVLPDNVTRPENHTINIMIATPKDVRKQTKVTARAAKSAQIRSDISEWPERPWHKDRTQLWNKNDQCAAPEKAWHFECSDVDDRTIFVLNSHTKTFFFKVSSNVDQSRKSEWRVPHDLEWRHSKQRSSGMQRRGMIGMVSRKSQTRPTLVGNLVRPVSDNKRCHYLTIFWWWQKRKSLIQKLQQAPREDRRSGTGEP